MIGAAVEGNKGKSPVKGALLGSLAQSAARIALNIAATAVAGFVLKKLFDQSTASTDDAHPPKATRSKRP